MVPQVGPQPDVAGPVHRLPLRGHRPHCCPRGGRARGHSADEAIIVHHRHAGQPLGCGGVDAAQPGAVRGRAQHRAVQHPGQADVGRELLRPCHRSHESLSQLGGVHSVEPGECGVQQLVRVDRHGAGTVSDQRAERNLATGGRIAHRPVRCDQAVRGDLPALRRLRQQRPPGRDGEQPQRMADVGGRAAAERAQVERRHLGVAHLDPDHRGRDGQLGGHHAGEGDPVALPTVHLAGVGTHQAAAVEGQPRTAGSRPAPAGTSVPAQRRQHDRPRAAGRGLDLHGTHGRVVGLGGRRLCGRAHRSQDPRVPAAPAQVAGERAADRGVVRIGVLREQGDRRHDHARRAVAALQRAGVDEGLLHRVQATVGSQSLHRGDRGAVGRPEVHGAGPHRRPVEQHGAGAALALAARVLRAGELQVVAQQVQQRRAGRRVHHSFVAVDEDPGHALTVSP